MIPGNVQEPVAAPRLTTRVQVTAAATAVVLGNLANILESVKKLSSAGYELIVFVWHGSRAIPVSLIVLGYGVIGLLTFEFLLRRFKSKRVAVGGAAGTAALLFAGNLFAVSPIRTPDGVWRNDLNQMTNRLMSASTRQGFRWDPSNPKADTQVWATAQSLVAILTAVPRKASYESVIRSGFAEIENGRKQDGWGYWSNYDWTVTELTSWVALAYIHSLGANIWNNAEREGVTMKILRDLKDISARQEASGGWRPIKESNEELTRTYSTTMALWAMVDARSEPLLAGTIGNQFDRNITMGVTWLLKNYHRAGDSEPSGWVPNPNRQDFREPFPGLTAQVLFVLDRVDRLDPNFFNSRTTYKQSKEAFLKSLDVPTCLSKLDTRMPDADVSLRPTQRMLEGSTFLWFPWTLAVVSDLAVDSELSGDQRQHARQARDSLFAKHDAVIDSVDSALTYEVAENLLGVSHALKRFVS